jgi:MYXO-CTERM domain-containing protein
MNRYDLALRGTALALVVGACGSAHAQAVITDWNFGSVAVTAAPYNSPTPTTGSGTATSLGMTNSYTYTSGGTYEGTGSVTSDDVANDSPSGSSNGSTLGNGDVWRIRGASGTGTSGKDNNGWNNSAPEYSQGAEFDVSTAGYTNISLSFDWAATTQGVGNLQVEYTTDGSTWTTVGSVLSATVDNNPTASGGSGFATDRISFSSIAAAANDPDFGVRLVSAFNPTLGNEYASATSVVSGAPAQYNNNSGNWRIADVQIDGTSAPVPLPATAWLAMLGVGGIALRVRRRRRGGVGTI